MRMSIEREEREKKSEKGEQERKWPNKVRYGFKTRFGLNVYS